MGSGKKVLLVSSGRLSGTRFCKTRAEDDTGGKVVFCTGGSGSICSAQVRALVYLGANACIMGRNEEKVERVARSIASARAGARVLGLGGVDVRNSKALVNAAQRCAKELGSIDFVMCVYSTPSI